jgi:TetR/AcrR family transcriptional repressor of nem operon
MGYSQAQKSESRKRVLDTAARQIRENGIEALGLADCMRNAGLTHGAFYGHFESRDALIAAAVEHALLQGKARFQARDKHSQNVAAEAESPLKTIADVYLNEEHADNPGNGCALCALAGDAGHADANVKALYTGSLRRLAERVARASANGTDGLAIVATIVGAITLARAVDDPALAKSILDSAHALVMTQDIAENP